MDEDREERLEERREANAEGRQLGAWLLKPVFIEKFNAKPQVVFKTDGFQCTKGRQR